MVAVRDTFPRRSAEYRATVKQMIPIRVRVTASPKLHPSRAAGFSPQPVCRVLDVRFGANNELKADIAACPKSARCRLNAQREASYSIRGVPHAVAPMLSGMNSCHSADHLPCLLADLAADDIAEQFPTLALEFPELKLLDRSEVNCAGVDRDTGQEPFQL